MKDYAQKASSTLVNLLRKVPLVALLALCLSSSLSLGNPPDNSININTASAEVIAETLTGIGLKRAQAIVAWRENHGAFTHKEQITAIKGIGESTLAKNEELIRLK
ncbi:MAG: ComEA family DNA-binding protein [Cellvibrionaceae bacterium]